MTGAVPVPCSDTRGYAYAWLCSGLAHGLVLAGATLLLSTLTLAPQPDVFRWHIAMVAPPTGATAEPDPSESPPETIPGRALPTLVRPPEPRPRVTRRTAEETVIEQVAGRVVDLPSPVPVPRRAATATIETMAASEPEREPPPKIVTRAPAAGPLLEAATTPQRAVQHREDGKVVIDRRNGVVVERQPSARTPAAAPVTEARMARLPETSSTGGVASVVRTRPPEVRQEAPAPIIAPASTPAEDVRLRRMPAATEVSLAEEPRLVTPAQQPVVTAARPAVRPAERRIPEPVVRDIEPEPEESAVQREMTTAPAKDPGSSVTEVAAKTREVPQPPAQRPDFGWVAKAIWRQVAQLKHYPHVARLNRWEGTVLIRAVIRADGSLGDLEVERSSGHAVLDEDAMELLRRASPLSLQYDLGRPQLTIRIPINYELE